MDNIAFIMNNYDRISYLMTITGNYAREEGAITNSYKTTETIEFIMTRGAITYEEGALTDIYIDNTIMSVKIGEMEPEGHAFVLLNIEGQYYYIDSYYKSRTLTILPITLNKLIKLQERITLLFDDNISKSDKLAIWNDTFSAEEENLDKIDWFLTIDSFKIPPFSQEVVTDLDQSAYYIYNHRFLFDSSYE